MKVITKSLSLPFERMVDVSYLRTLLAHVRAGRLPVESTIPAASKDIYVSAPAGSAIYRNGKFVGFAGGVKHGR